MGKERRQHQRFSATAFLNTPVHMTPLLPYWGDPCDGLLLDLSAGGVSILIDQMIPQGTNLNMELVFPDKSLLKTVIEVNHVLARGDKYLHGIQFLVIEPEMVERIENMSGLWTAKALFPPGYQYI